MQVRPAKAILIVECFQRAILDADSQLRLIHMFAAVLCGSQVNFHYCYNSAFSSDHLSLFLHSLLTHIQKTV